MTWKNKIPSCFGMADKVFAGHNIEITHAQNVLNEALLSNVGFCEYVSEAEAWLKSQGCKPDHIETQIDRIKNLTSYFKND